MWLEQEVNFRKLWFVFAKGYFNNIKLFRGFDILLLNS